MTASTQTQTAASHVAFVAREDVPAGSFRYGQLARVESFDVRPDAYAVCTNCSTPINPDDNGASGFRTILVAHFTFRDRDEAIRCANSLKSVGPVTIVRPVALAVETPPVERRVERGASAVLRKFNVRGFDLKTRTPRRFAQVVVRERHVETERGTYAPFAEVFKRTDNYAAAKTAARRYGVSSTGVFMIVIDLETGEEV